MIDKDFPEEGVEKNPVCLQAHVYQTDSRDKVENGSRLLFLFPSSMLELLESWIDCLIDVSVHLSRIEIKNRWPHEVPF